MPHIAFFCLSARPPPSSTIVCYCAPNVRLPLQKLLFCWAVYRLAVCVQSILMSGAAAVECVEQACEQIQASRHLAEVLRAVLATGNTLNAGTHRGQAVGIKLESLNKLADVKARSLAS